MVDEEIVLATTVVVEVVVGKGVLLEVPAPLSMLISGTGSLIESTVTITSANRPQ